MAGTTKNYRLHDIQIPDQLINSMPQINQTVYLYTIKIEPGFTALPDSDDAGTEIFHKLFKSNRSYGILTSIPLPRIGDMKFYQSFGMINCSINHNTTKIFINDANELRKLQKFHYVLFHNILDIKKSFFVFDLKNSYIIVPTILEEIDWSIIESFQSWSSLRKKTTEECTRAKYNPEEWLYNVVCPWYRADYATRYVVTNVYEQLTPLSPFPNSSYPTYASYVTDKYNVPVIRNDQFLIQVKGITTRLNRLNPGQGEGGRKKTVTRGRELLIPELCHNFKYPGDLWLKATNLPSILHRLPYLLHAEKLRINLNKYVGINIVDYYPEPVIDNMIKSADPLERAEISNSIIYPKPNESKEVEINHVTLLSQTSDCPWPVTEEPVDLERKFDKIYPFEIDYYYDFINRKFDGLSLIDKNNTTLSQRVYKNQQLPMALCDTPPNDKLVINLLHLNQSSSTIRGVEQHELLAALTAASSADVFNMERLEVLGDAFLKFGASLYLIETHENWHEGYLTTIKGTMVSNRNLCYNAIRMKIPGMIKVQNFNPKDDWLPPMLMVPEFVQVITMRIKRFYSIISFNF